MMKVGEDGIRCLRQAMLSCTVENKHKRDLAEKLALKSSKLRHAGRYESQRMLWVRA